MKVIQKIHPYIFAGLDEQKSFVSSTTLKSLFKSLKTALNVSGVDLKSKSRKQEVKEARQIFHFIAYKELRLSLAYIGKLTNRDHSTVLHSVRFIEDRVFSDYKDEQVLAKFNMVKDCLTYEKKLITRTQN